MVYFIRSVLYREVVSMVYFIRSVLYREVVSMVSIYWKCPLSGGSVYGVPLLGVSSTGR